MKISKKDWNNYINRMSRLNKKAGQLMRAYVEKYGIENSAQLIAYANALITKYGEGSAELAAQLYDAIAEAEGVAVKAAVPAKVADYGTVARAVNGTKNNLPVLASAVSRLVKQAGADTMLQNAQRDGAEFAWIPSGDSCAFCITLASRGWQKQGKAAREGIHAKHIHANCDCNYTVRFSEKTTVEGYDPEQYKRMYDGAEGTTPQEKINTLRRQQYRVNGDKLREQKKVAYVRRANNQLNKIGDPIYDIYGPIEESHPDKMQKILEKAKELNVEVAFRQGSMAYSPGKRPGLPGKLIISKGDSVGAWVHEAQHMIDDYEAGYIGLPGLMNIEVRAQMEYNAYSREIEIARRAGRQDVVKELTKLCKNEILRIGGKWDVTKLG